MSKSQRLFRAAALCLRVFLAVPLCAAAGAQENAQEKEKRNVAILEPTGNAAVTAMNKSNVRGALQEVLVSSGRYTVINRNQMEQILREQRFQRSSLADASRAKQLGQLLGADLICVTEMLKERGEVIINCDIIDVETAAMADSRSQFLENDSNPAIRRGVENLLSRMLGIETPSQAQARQQLEAEERAKFEIREGLEREARERQAREKQEREKQERENPSRVAGGGGRSLTDRLFSGRGGNTEKEEQRLAAESKVAALRADPASESRIRGAKTEINRLMPYFNFDKKRGGAVSCVNKAIEQYQKQQQESVGKKQQNYWHSLSVKIDHANGLTARSMYVFKNKTDKLSHTILSVTIDKETRTTVLNLKTSLLKTLGTTSEEAEIPNLDILRFIANNPRKKIHVRLENTSGQYKEYILDTIVQQAIAQTLELYNAISILTQYGEEIQQHYWL